MQVPVTLQNYLIEWPLSPEQGEFLSQEEILSSALQKKDLAGITRVADITGLDVVGIPTFCAIRPWVDQYDENISVFSGKGIDSNNARLSALMEAYERFSAERHGRLIFLDTLTNIQKCWKTIPPQELILPKGEKYEANEWMEWIPGRNLLNGEIEMVPANAVFIPYRPEGNARFIKGFASSNGLAAGSSHAHAILNGMLEIIERDGVALAEHRQDSPNIDLASIDSPIIQCLLNRFKQAGIHVYVKDIRSEFKIPSFFVAIDDPLTENPLLLCGGVGTHFNKEIALIKALTEAAQSRVVYISGSREDLADGAIKSSLGYWEVKNRMSCWYEPSSRTYPFHEISDDPNLSVRESIDQSLKVLSNHGFEKVLAIKLTLHKLQIPVMRIIIPGLECSAEESRIGPRGLKMLMNSPHFKVKVRV